MFRRRFARPLRRPMRPGIQPLLRRANELFAIGNFAAAAQDYEQLARGAQARGLPYDAQFFLQEGRCRILAGQVLAGMDNLKQGLAIIANRGNWKNLSNVGPRLVAELNQHGLTVQAAEIEAWLKQTIPASFVAGSAAGPVKKPVLPTSCPGCGGPLRSDEVEWADDVTAECPYCGGTVRAEA
jgi:hypothetical protein